MLRFSVFLLATSALVGAAVLPRQGSDIDKPTTYKPDIVIGKNVNIAYNRPESVVPENVPAVSHLPAQQPFQRQSAATNVPVQPVQNVFPRQEQPVKNAEFIRVQPVQPQQPFVQQEAKPVVPLSRTPVAYQQVGVVPKSGIVDQGFQPQQPVAGEVAPTQYASAQILRQVMDVSPDGSFANDWDSDNGINVHERGVVKHVGDDDVVVQSGEISYVGDDGKTYSIKYVADETGYHVEGDHLPTPPPIPEAILRGLQYIKDHPYVETTTLPAKEYEPGQQGQAGQPAVIDN